MSDSYEPKEQGDLPIGFCHQMRNHAPHPYVYMGASCWCKGQEAPHEPSPSCGCDLCLLVKKTLGTFA